MTTPTPIEALRELVACADVSVPYAVLKTPGYRWHDAITAARAALAAAEKAEPVESCRSIVDRASIQAGMPQRTRLHLLRRFDALCAAPKATP